MLFSTKKRFNPYTSGLLLAVGFMLMGLLLCTGQWLAWERHHPASPLPLQPVIRVAESDLEPFPLLPHQLGALAWWGHGERGLFAYHPDSSSLPQPNIRWGKPALSRHAEMRPSSPGYSGSSRLTDSRYRYSRGTRLAHAHSHGLYSRLAGRLRHAISNFWSAKTG